MTKKLLLVSFLLFVNKIANSQHIKIDNGILFSSYDNSKNLPILYDKVKSYSVNFGVDYFEKKWFYLSSQIGYNQIGGIEENPLLADELKHVKENKNYIHLNTTFRAFKEFSNLQVFIGAGPYLNILAGTKKFEGIIYHDFYDAKTYVGGKTEVGITHDINKFRIGLVGSYMLSVTPTSSSVGLNLRNNNLGAVVSIGYDISQ